ncbi:MAG: hypothetical protein FJ098_17215, partial [Deltaproteobacteria bacterium]|nr:hypothetical protein [Deltaproteobacteria bacterium]
MHERREAWWYYGTAVGWAIIYLTAGFLLPTVFGIDRGLFGVDRLRAFGPFVPLVALLAALAWLAWRRGAAEGPIRLLRDAARRWPRRATAVGMVAMAGASWALRTRFYSSDSIAFGPYFEYFVPRQGFYLRHDEIWEFVLHSVAWRITHAWFDWTVLQAYQVVNCLAAGLAVPLLALVAREHAPTRPLTFIALAITGGWIQLYFGDPENYTLTSLWLLLYFLLSARHLRGHTPLVAPAAALAGAMTFHMLSAFLLPALGWMALRRLRARQWAEVRLAFLVAVFIVFITVFLFHFLGVPAEHLIKKSFVGGFGGHQYGVMINRLSWNYHSQVLQLMLLLCPLLPLLVPLLLFRRIPGDAISVHLAISAVMMLLFIVFWRSIIGLYNDWNLFSAFALPFTLLIA